jgi:tetratricopeptide (TPR) repeat protein
VDDILKISFPDFQFTLEGRVRKLFQMLRICLVLSFLLSGFQVFATEDVASQDLFQKGLAAYQNKKYDEARDDFQKMLDQGVVSARLLHNLALTYFQMNQKPRALAFWRKALAVDPSYSAARVGRDVLENHMGMRPFEKDSLSLWIRRTMESISFFELLWVIALILAASGTLWIRYASERRHALDEDRSLPPFPTVAALITVLLVACLGLVGGKFYYAETPHGTIVSDKATAHSLPADEGVGLFDIPGGTEVVIKREENGWKQIQNPEGSTGWVKDSDIIKSSEG